ncbi:hypothetical protein M422DRAFT_268476 [Sphaerobolus stellatus SS14]|uniref:Uncharacterized protein n=1 Tax=Sphaerobolus stellatus (strain SS14) TaxID=990650 RepID=A0A0C9UY46_SPHS4|nr:hypothetical protein M422DRAFT_268476 [Sphaerobolus stellatus SS14]
MTLQVDLRRFNPHKIHDHIISASIADIIRSKRRTVNILDIPNSTTVVIPRFIQQVSLDGVAGQLATGPGFPHQDTRWNLFAKVPALTHLHYDAGKLCTWIQVQ